MEKSTCSRHRRAHRRRYSAPCLSLAALTLTACATAGAGAPTPAGTAWRESFYENFALDLSNGEVECVATEVGALTRMVGPLVGQRPDDTANSIWAAVDRCLAPSTRGALARAIVYGAWSADAPTVAGRWATLDDTLAACVDGAGGWRALGSYAALTATCAPERAEEAGS